MNIKPVSITFLFTISSFLHAQNSLLKDSNGWTVFTPHSETRIIYVSSSEGNDDSGVVYTPGSTGTDPFVPSGKVKSFKTIAAAYKASKNNSPDWILLKKDDIWYESLQNRNGLSDDAPFLVSSYGTGQKRPLLKTGNRSGINYCCKNFNNVAFVDLDFYAHTRDFDSDEYSDSEGSSGFNFYVGEDFTGTGVLIEGCRFRFYTNNTIQGPGKLEKIVIRRNVIVDNYSSSAHSQGLYAHNIGLTLEENVFDHNGWYKKQADGGNEQDSGQATMFNHNTYFSNCKDVIFRKNLFLRASSIGNKWTANSGEASAQNIVIDNNLYVEGEIGISMGGNETEPPYRFKSITITNNVMLDIGRGQPTNRTLGWGLEINDWDSGRVSRNYFLHKTNPVVNNVYGINIIGQTRNVTLDSNVIYGLNTGGQLISVDSGNTKKDILFKDNILNNQNNSGRLIKVNGSLQNYEFSGNSYFSSKTNGQWFEINKTFYDIDTWKVQSQETKCVAGNQKFADPDRHIETYMKHLGKTASFEQFISMVREQCKSNWRVEYTAPAINSWIKEGFENAATENLKWKKTDRISPENISFYKVYNLNGRYIGSTGNKESILNYSPKGILIYKPVLIDKQSAEIQSRTVKMLNGW